MARSMAGAGADIVIAEVSADLVQPAIDELRAINERCTGFRTDVSDWDAVEGMVASVLERLGRIDILVHNATHHHHYAKVADLPVEQWDGIRAVNFDAMFYTAKAVLPHLVAQGSGSIIGISSGATTGIRSDGFTVAYAAAKQGIERLLRGLAFEMEEHGVSVNGIRLEKGVASPGALEYYGSRADAMGLLPPEAMGQAALYIASQGTPCTGNIFELKDLRPHIPRLDELMTEAESRAGIPI